MARFETHFTLDEANELLPWVRATFARIHDALREIADGIARLTEFSLRGSVNGTAHSRKHHAYQFSEDIERRRREKLDLANKLLRLILQEGIVIQDVERGLIDFPAWRGESEVLLCFELADGDRIGFWHGLDDGYAGRRPIEEF